MTSSVCINIVKILFGLISIVLLNVQGWRSFKVIQENVYVNITAPDYVKDAQIYIRKLNHTFDALNSSATFLKGFEKSLIVWARSFEMRGTRYHPSVLDTKLDLCKFFDNPLMVSPIFAIFYPQIVAHGNWPTKCPIPAGEYHMYNFNVNEEAFPIYFPINRWRYLLSLIYQNRTIFESVWSFRVESKRFNPNKT